MLLRIVYGEDKQVSSSDVYNHSQTEKSINLPSSRLRTPPSSAAAVNRQREIVMKLNSFTILSPKQSISVNVNKGMGNSGRTVQ